LTESSALRSGRVSLVCLVTPVVAVSSGAKALGTLLHEASIIATKERAEMKMIEFFIARKIVVDGAGHSIKKRRALQSVQESSMVLPFNSHSCVIL